MAGHDMLMAEETLFRDDSVFNPDHMPDQFSFREAQLKELTYALRPALRGGRPSNAFLIGPPATGKTTALHVVFGELAKETNRVMTVHVNCHMHPSPYKIFSEIYKKAYGISPPDTGIPLAKVQDDVFMRLSKEKKALVVALDDVSYMFDSGIANDVLYMILRAHESFPGVVTAVFAVATEDIVHKLDDRVRSIFSPVRIPFPGYSGNEILQILRRRCDAGLYPDVMPGDLLERIASSSSDLRFGIELVKQAAMAAEADAERRIGERHLEKALASMTFSGSEGDSRSKILSIIRSKGQVESGELYKAYNEGAGGRADEKQMSYTTFYRLLQRLKAEGAVSIDPVNKARGKTSVIRAK